MKASEMTNEDLANLIEEGCGTSLTGHAVREAAARLRRVSHKRKITEKDAEIAMRLVRLSKENERLKAALKPVLDCELHIGDSLTEAVGEIGTSSKYGVCDEEGSDLWNEDIADSLNAVRGAQRIFKESEHEITAGLVKENELLKQEIDAKDAEIAGLRKLVKEMAVALKFTSRNYFECEERMCVLCGKKFGSPSSASAIRRTQSRENGPTSCAAS